MQGLAAKKVLAEAVLRALLLEARTAAAEPELKFLDPPLLTTPTLRRLGYGRYRIQQVWEGARAVASIREVRYRTLYRYGDTEFRLLPQLSEGPVRILRDHGVPLDDYDCHKAGDRCYSAPRGNRFYVYIEGHVENSALRVNTVYLAVLLTRSGGWHLLKDLASALMGFAYSIAESLCSGESVEALLQELSDIMARERRLLELVLPHVPRSPEELLRLSPALRFLALSCRKRAAE